MNIKNDHFSSNLSRKPLNYDTLITDEFNALIFQGLADFKHGETLTSKQVRKAILNEL